MQHLVVLSGSGCSLGADGPSMKDLWLRTVGDPANERARRVAQRVNHDLERQDIEALLSRVEAYLQVYEDDEVRSFFNNSKAVILYQCSQFLRDEKIGAHKTFIHRLSRRRTRDPRLKIFSTNYDLCFERAAGAIGSVVLDGFSFASPRRYDPEFFNYDIIRRDQSNEDAGSYLAGVFLVCVGKI